MKNAKGEVCLPPTIRLMGIYGKKEGGGGGGKMMTMGRMGSLEIHTAVHFVV
jgi:hypothetical protein